MKESLVPDDVIINKIYLIRDQKVMLDKDLADLYGVTTGNLNKAVGRNIKRFPEDFMFKLTKEEFDNLKSQIDNSSWGGTRKLPKAFTEQGVAMLSGILHSERAILVNIQIMRAYIRIREMLLTHKDLLLKMEKLENQVTENSESIKLIFTALKKLLNPDKIERKQIGYKLEK
jgi:hypothetical protein